MDCNELPAFAVLMHTQVTDWISPNLSDAWNFAHIDRVKIGTLGPGWA